MDKETLHRLEAEANRFLPLFEDVMREAEDCHEFAFRPPELQPLRDAFLAVVAVAAPGVVCERVHDPLAWHDTFTLRSPE